MTEKKKVFILTSSLLTDRMIIYSDFIKIISAEVDYLILSTSFKESKESWEGFNVTYLKSHTEKFFPHSFLRHINQNAYDRKSYLPSRLGMKKFYPKEKKILNAYKLTINFWGFLIYTLKLQKIYEKFVKKFLIKYTKDEEFETLINKEKPDYFITFNPFWANERKSIAILLKNKVRGLCFIPSWDNITTKERLIFDYEFYSLWSNIQKEQLNKYYNVPKDIITTVGAPQYDIFINYDKRQKREEFCKERNLDPQKKIILIALGSPNFIDEKHTCLILLDAKKQKLFSFEVEIIIRPHPVSGLKSIEKFLSNYKDQYFLDGDIKNINSHSKKSKTMNKSDVYNWINVFSNVDLVIQIASTVIFDSLLNNKPVINLNYDPSPRKDNQNLVVDINQNWTHFKDISKYGVIEEVYKEDELIPKINNILLNNKEINPIKRDSLLKNYIEYTDGKSAERLANFILKSVSIS